MVSRLLGMRIVTRLRRMEGDALQYSQLIRIPTRAILITAVISWRIRRR